MSCFAERERPEEPDVGPRVGPNRNNPHRSPLEPTPNDPFAIPEDADEMPVQNPTPGGAPPAPATKY